MAKKTKGTTNLIEKICFGFYKFVLYKRYKVEISGKELLQQTGGKLILPNHPSQMDPQLMVLELFPNGGLVPVIAERFFRIPVIRYFLKRWGAIPVSDFKKGSRDLEIVKKISSAVLQSLEDGKNVIIFPAGQLSDQGFEIIKNKQSAYTIAKDLPIGVKIIGVRISGLWGSTWSKAWTGKQPIFFLLFIKGFFIILFNFIFFVPKRKVKIELEDITQAALKHAQQNRISFNSYLESFYNKNEPEKASFISHFFFLPSIKSHKNSKSKKKSDQ